MSKKAIFERFFVVLIKPGQSSYKNQSIKPGQSFIKPGQSLNKNQSKRLDLKEFKVLFKYIKNAIFERFFVVFN